MILLTLTLGALVLLLSWDAGSADAALELIPIRPNPDDEVRRN